MTVSPNSATHLTPVKPAIVYNHVPIELATSNDREYVHIYSAIRGAVLVFESFAVDFGAGWRNQDSCGCWLGRYIQYPRFGGIGEVSSWR